MLAWQSLTDPRAAEPGRKPNSHTLYSLMVPEGRLPAAILPSYHIFQRTRRGQGRKKYRKMDREPWEGVRQEEREVSETDREGRREE